MLSRPSKTPERFSSEAPNIAGFARAVPIVGAIRWTLSEGLVSAGEELPVLAPALGFAVRIPSGT